MHAKRHRSGGVVLHSHLIIWCQTMLRWLLQMPSIRFVKHYTSEFLMKSGLIFFNNFPLTRQRFHQGLGVVTSKLVHLCTFVLLFEVGLIQWQNCHVISLYALSNCIRTHNGAVWCLEFQCGYEGYFSFLLGDASRSYNGGSARQTWF